MKRQTLQIGSALLATACLAIALVFSSIPLSGDQAAKLNSIAASIDSQVSEASADPPLLTEIKPIADDTIAASTPSAYYDAVAFYSALAGPYVSSSLVVYETDSINRSTEEGETGTMPDI